MIFSYIIFYIRKNKVRGQNNLKCRYSWNNQFLMTKYITKNALACARVQMQMGNKGNVVLYLDKELVEKSKELGFNLSRTFENQLKNLITQFSTSNSLNNLELSSKSRTMAGGEGFEPSTQVEMSPTTNSLL